MIELAAAVGWDWADRKHQICLREPGADQVEQYEIKATPEALHDWALKMLERYGGRPIGICIETSRSPVISAFMRYGHIVFHPVNPMSAKSFRDGFHPSGKKDDPVDADGLCEMLAFHQHKLKPFDPADPETRLLGLLSEHRRKLVDDRVRELNRLRAALKMYFPQALQLCGELGTPMSCDFLDRWSELEALQRARSSMIETFYRAHNCRQAKVIEQRLELIDRSKPLTNDPALVRAGKLEVRSLVRVIRSLNDAIGELEGEIAAIFADYPEFDLITSMPGAAEALGPRLAAILGTDRQRITSREQLQKLTGIAPVTSKSGNTISVHRRIKRNVFIQQTCVEWAAHARNKSVWADAYYRNLRAEGKGHNAALRALAFKLLRILYYCWQNRIPYDEQTHLESLRKAGSRHAVAA